MQRLCRCNWRLFINDKKAEMEIVPLKNKTKRSERTVAKENLVTMYIWIKKSKLNYFVIHVIIGE